MKNLRIESAKIPPQARELELVVLGAILIDSNAFNEVSSILTSECFYVPAHELIYRAYVSLNAKGMPIDVLTVNEELTMSANIDKCGGLCYINELTNSIGSSANIATHAKIIYQKYMMREAIRLSVDIIERAYDDTTDPFALIDKAQIQFAKIVDRIKSSNVVHVADVALATIKAMQENRYNQSEYLGIESGLKKIDNITYGFTNPDLIILAGGTSEGKSTLALQIAQYASLSKKVAFFSLEMSNQQLLWKILSSEVNATITQIRRGHITDYQWRKVEGEVYDKMLNSQLYMYDEGGLSIFELISMCRNLKAKDGIDMVVIDYLQLLTATGGDMKFGIREQEINFISKKLKALAKELDIPIIALSQLSRIERGAKRLYKLSDLRESGAIEQDADGVIFVFRPHYHGILDMSINGSDMTFDESDTIIQFAKWRLGETGVTTLRFNKEFSKFEDSNITHVKSFDKIPFTHLSQEIDSKEIPF